MATNASSARAGAADARGGLDGRTPTKPALKALHHDQRALLAPSVVDDPVVDHGLRGGFPHRKAVISWYQRAVVRTLGYVADYIPPATLARDHVVLSALIVETPRRNWDPNPMSLENAAIYRRRIETRLVEACRRAYNELRKHAGEYIDPEDDERGNLDPARQENVAMRPAFQEFDDGQAAALDRLWGGFEDVDHLLEWTHWLSEPTNGAIEAALPTMIRQDDVLRGHLLGRSSPAQARRYRERFAIGADFDRTIGLLPAYVSGIKRAEAGELASHRQQSTVAPPPG